MDWSAWRLDWFTWGWIIWLLFFMVWEGLAVRLDVTGTLTYHLRPVFHAAPVTWYVGVAVWLWLGPHFFYPGFERMFHRLLGS